MGKVTRRWVDGGGQPGGERGRERADRACEDKEMLRIGRRGNWRRKEATGREGMGGDGSAG